MKKPTKLRLDHTLVSRGLFPSREKAQAAIIAGEIWNGQKRLDKPGEMIPEDISLEIKSKATKYVSRAGEKLEFALQAFAINPKDKIALDVGASTGGFTDCLLKFGAKHIFSVDVGYGQLDISLRKHSQVTCVEKTNARSLKWDDLIAKSPLAHDISLLVMDVSFISVKKIIPHLKVEFENIQDWIILFKPQFEVGKEHIRKGGVVSSPQITQGALKDFQEFVQSLGFKIIGSPVLSPVEGKKSGNQEYLLFFRR